MNSQAHSITSGAKTPVILKRWALDGRYRILATTIRKDGFDLKQVARVRDVAVYEKTKGKYKGYEAIVIRNREEYIIAGKTIEAAEVYPSNEDWGMLGFTYPDFFGAMNKLTILLEHRDQVLNYREQTE